MSQSTDTNKQTSGSTKPSLPSREDTKREKETTYIDTVLETNDNEFVGIERLRRQINEQLKEFETWYAKGTWLDFHNHHYDWWMFPIDEISSRGRAYCLPPDVLNELKRDKNFVDKLRRGVKLMVSSWGWDIDACRHFDKRADKQKWSYWPVRLYKAGKCMWLFDQKDYYKSLRRLAEHIRDNDKEKLDYFSHTKNGKANVIEQWDELERL
ncbi:unnamed protein product [Adineta ricciae]|uniref:Uncharacterized protein n=1 Tax=Adineta ricciae TaxID=249248 RepID=A0A814AX20_ADIRI|nr:unnamed protein product [Adineta ricciae]CAF1099480.1 unnamed protein product [Adineta ricciae]